MGDADLDFEGTSSREKTSLWLESVLQTYFTFTKRNGRSEAEKENIPLVNVVVTEFDIGPGYAADSRLSTLSDLLAIKVNFKVDDEPEEKTEHLVVKIPPNDLADREMAHLAQVDKREIHFYTEALVQMQNFVTERRADISLNVPKCYFAKYHKQASSENESVTGFGEAESVLVLQDIRPSGYSMRDCTAGLTIEETKAALREIAVFHAVSWAMQESQGVKLQEKWDFSYRPRKAASAYKMLVEQGFPTLAGFLEKVEPDGADLLQRLKTLHPKAADLLCDLLEPPAPPAPSCLTHMDYWCNNLLFRVPEVDQGLSDNGNSDLAEGQEPVPTECQIVDWQMMTISRPTHDVALLLFTSLSPELRQENTSRLLEYYWTAFQRLAEALRYFHQLLIGLQDTARKLGVELPFDFACIESEFSKSQLLALLLVIGSIDLALDAEATETRLMNALRDIAKEGLF